MNEPQLCALIVDDERPARVALRELLELHSHVKIVGEADSVSTAVNLCYQVRPNLLFLDVQMEDGTGFDVLTKLSTIPATIFVTAYEQFAIRAFQVNAIHYLLKPVSPDQIAHALERIKHKQPSLFNGQLTLDDIVSRRVVGHPSAVTLSICAAGASPMLPAGTAPAFPQTAIADGFRRRSDGGA